MGRQAFDLTIRFSIGQQKRIHILAALDGVPPSTWARAVIEAEIERAWPEVSERVAAIEQLDDDVEADDASGREFVNQLLGKERA